jgi:hypothetical protein
MFATRGDDLMGAPLLVLLVVSFSCVACSKPAVSPAKSSASSSSSVATRKPALPQPSNPSSSAKPKESSLDTSIRGADFEGLMQAQLVRRLNGKETVEEACAGRTQPVEIEQTVFGDLDGDGKEEAAVTAISCQAGSAGPDLFAVFKRAPSGEIIEMPFEPREPNQLFNGRDPSVGLRGAPLISIENGKLVQSFGIFTDKDQGCCASGGTRKFIYRWDGHQFALDDVVDVPPEKTAP